MKKILTISFLLLINSFVFAQRDKLVVLSKYHEGKVMLRWAPSDYFSWKKGVENGYFIERITLTELNENGSWKVLNTEPLKPDALDAMTTKITNGNRNLALAAQMLYGKIDIPSENFGEYIANKKYEQDNRYILMMAATSKGMDVAIPSALGFIDSDINTNENYAYRIIIKGIDTAYCYAKVKNYSKEIYSPSLNLIGGEKTVNISWDVTGSIYWGFMLEKRQKGEQKWLPLNSIEMVHIENEKDSFVNSKGMQFTDSVKSNYTVFEYRIVGTDAFGIKETDNTIYEGFGRDKTAPSIAFDVKAIGLTDSKIKIEWNWKGLENENDLSHFRLDRASNTEFYFTPIADKINKSNLLFEDKNPNRLGNNYYRIASIDTAGNESYSAFAYGMVYDTVAPSAPSEFFNTVDSNGVVKLTWKKPKDMDIMGYRVFFANQNDHEFTNLTGYPITDTLFIDTLNTNTLTRHGFYKVLALDYNFNHSQLSKSIKIVRPDKIAPQSPIFTDYFTDGNMVKITWIPSYSSDAATIVIKRKLTSDNNWIELYEGINQKDTQFIDTKIEKNSVYEYKIYCIDSSGLASKPTKNLTVKTMPQLYIDSITNFKLSHNIEKQMIQLDWNYKLAPNLYFVIYKSMNNAEFESIDFVESTLTFNDKNIKTGNIYSYYIKPIKRNGSEGMKCTPLKIIIN